MKAKVIDCMFPDEQQPARVYYEDMTANICGVMYNIWTVTDDYIEFREINGSGVTIAFGREGEDFGWKCGMRRENGFYCIERFSRVQKAHDAIDGILKYLRKNGRR